MSNPQVLSVRQIGVIATRLRAGLIAIMLLACAPVADLKAQISPAAAPPACALPGGETVRVQAVGPHLDIRLADGRLLALRGLRAPKGTKAWPELAQMARMALDGWVNGQNLLARIDRGPADRWGRHFADLWMQAPVAGAEAGGKSIAAGLIEAGWGIVASAGVETDCLGALLRLEQHARAANLGLWSDRHYRLLAADDTAALTGRAGQYVLAEGLVHGVRRWRNLTFINFGKGRGNGLAIMLRARARRNFEVAGANPDGFTGKTLRVRGIVELRNGPRMVLDDPKNVEIIQ